MKVKNLITFTNIYINKIRLKMLIPKIEIIKNENKIISFLDYYYQR